MQHSIRFSDELEAKISAVAETRGMTFTAVVLERCEEESERYGPELEKWIAWRAEVKEMTRHVYLESLLNQMRREFVRQEQDPDLKARVRYANRPSPNGVVPASELPKIAPRK